MTVIADSGNSLIREVNINGIITTVAGDGSAGYTGDGGAGTSASLSNPSAVAVDAHGDLYIADVGNNVIREVDTNGIITTVAGDGTVGYTGDGGAAMFATFSGPSGLAVDGYDDLFIADAGNNVIREITANGVITTVAGNGIAGFSGDGGSATNATLSKPVGVVVDFYGNLFVADTGNNVVRRIDASGIVSTVAGNGSNGYTGDGGAAVNANLNSPAGVAVDASGNLFTADSGNNVVRKVVAGLISGQFTRTLTLYGAVTNEAGLYSVIISNSVGSATSCTAVLRVLLPLVISTQPTNMTTTQGSNAMFSASASGNPPLSYQWYFNGTNQIAGATYATLWVQNVQPADAGIYSVIVSDFTDSVTSTNAELIVTPPTVQPVEQTVVQGSNITFSVEANAPGPLNYQWQHDGTNLPLIITTVAGNGSAGYAGDGGVATNASLTRPSDVSADALGNFFIADSGNNVIREVNSNGIITTVVGNGFTAYLGNWGAATNASLNGPSDVVADACGNLFIADNGNNVIRKVDTNGIITTVAGNGCAGYAGDGGAATNASLSEPTAVTVDVYGDLFIVDNGNSVIREVDTNGIIITVAGNGSVGYAGDGGAATNASLSNPSGIAVDVYGDMFIADTDNSVIREVNTSGIITTVAGNGSAGYAGDGGAATNATLSNPSGLTMDVYGDLFIADSANNVIREVDANAIITTVVGNGNAGYTGDGAPATGASLSEPSGVAVDACGNLFIADTANNVIRAVWAEQSTLTLNNVMPIDAGDYSVLVGGLNGTVSSSNMLLTVLAPPAIVKQPGFAVAFQGTTAMLNVIVGGTAPFSYQWYFNNTNLLIGATNSILTITNVQTANVGNYQVVVTNLEGSTTSSNGWLAICPMTFTMAVGGERILDLTNGDVVSWGGNQFGELGDYTDLDSTNPVHIVGLTNISKISSGFNHSLAIDSNGALWVWGDNQYAQLGNKTLDGTNLPIQVFMMTNPAIAIAGGDDGSAAVGLNGTVWWWGTTIYDSCGFASGPTLLPTQVAGLTNVIAVAAGGQHFLALRGDGSVWAWGAEWCGEFGDGNLYTCSQSAVQSLGLSNIVAICAGENHSMALDASGQVWAWGVNITGQLGDDNAESASALPILVFSNATQIAAGVGHSLALDAQGNLWAWGSDSTGQLGDAGSANLSVPTQVLSVSNIVVIAAGSDASLALDSDGRLWQWGASDGDETNWLWSGADGYPQIPQSYTNNYNGQLPKIVVLNGTNQLPVAGEEFQQPLVFQVRDTNGMAFTNAPIVVEVLSGDMELRIASGGANQKGLRLNTDASGLVSLIGYVDQSAENLVCAVRLLAASREMLEVVDVPVVPVPTPFVLIVTNPVNALVSQPLIQVQGYANSALQSLSYDLVNVNGTWTNMAGYFVNKSYNVYTNSSFQCFDLPLALGTNGITLRAADLAGRVVTTNICVTLDYSNVTTPPVLSVVWPLNGTYISGSTFSLQGQVDQVTAFVNATIADSCGNSNKVQGLVERDGTVWINNLPLSTGANVLTITATDAAGNSTTTNLTVFQSTVQVTLNPLTSDQLNQAVVNVTGTVSDPSCQVYVNGVQATVNSDGSWEADGVPAHATGVASFDVEIYPAIVASAARLVALSSSAAAGNANPIGSQIFSINQPLAVVLTSIQQYSSFDGAEVASVDWNYLSGGNYSYTGLLGWPGGGNLFTVGKSSILPDGQNYSPPALPWNNQGIWNTFNPPWSMVDCSVMSGWTAQSSVRTTQGIVSSTTVPGVIKTYLVGASAQYWDPVMGSDTGDPSFEEPQLFSFYYNVGGGSDIPVNELLINGQKLLPMTCQIGPIWGPLADSLDGGPPYSAGPKLWPAPNWYSFPANNWGQTIVTGPAGAVLPLVVTTKNFQHTDFNYCAPDGVIPPDFTFNIQAGEIPPPTTDANRDGHISFDGSDDTSPSNPFRFWINDSEESGDIASGSEVQIPGALYPNYLKSSPNGRADYVNYFPVALQMTNLLQWLPLTNGYAYHLSQADKAVKFIYTSLTLDNASEYLTNAIGANEYGFIDWRFDPYGSGPIGYTTLDQASLVSVASSGPGGTTLNTNWLALVQRNGGTGILLMEGAAITTQPLMLEIWHPDQSGTMQLVASVPMYLSISGVEHMYRQLNLRVGTPKDSALAGNLSRRNQDPGLATQVSQPSNFPDSALDGGWFIFIVGSNVGGLAARGWESEVFKRLYWSGNMARFIGVSWYGDPYLDNEGVYDYHMAVRNAFATTPALESFVNGLSGKKTIAGHSLSCLIIASAIAQQGMTVNHACLMDAAFAQECIDGTADDNLLAMRPSTWIGYPDDLFAAHWHEQFDSSDARSTLTWRNEFLGAVDNIYSFYSSTEDCLGTTYRDVPGNSGLSTVNSVLALVNDNGNTHNYVWEYQEKAKGVRQYYDVPLVIGSFHAGSTYGGWGFNLKDPLLRTDPVWYELNISGNAVVGRRAKTPAEIGTVGVNLLSATRWTPLFKTGWGTWVDAGTVMVDTSPVYYTGPSWIFNLYARNSTGSMVAADPVNRAELLAEAIPALSLPVGANYSTQVSPGRQFNMPVQFADQKYWPRSFNSGSIPNWHHSDMDQVSYPFLFRLYNQLVSISNQ